MHKRIVYVLPLLFLIGFFNSSKSQNIPIGAWQDHLPYNDAVSVAEANGLIYCATSSALFSYDLADNSIQRINQVNGLSDINVSEIKFNQATNRLVVAYSNGNIDIIDENKTIINISAIKNSSVIGNKAINDIYIKNELAYLSTGFGIVVLDVNRMEIKDTYLIGSLGGYINVNSITMDTLNIYAATDEGVYQANQNAANLADNNEWSTIPQLKDSVYSNIVYFSNRLFLIQKRIPALDSVFVGIGGAWQPFVDSAGYTNNICLLRDNAIAILWNWGASFYDASLSKYGEIYNYSPKDLIRANSFEYWMADADKGLVHLNDPWDSNVELIQPNSPTSASIFDVDLHDDNLWFVSGGFNFANYGPSYLFDNLVNFRREGTWSTLGKTIGNIDALATYDAVCVAVNPNNTSQAFFGTWDYGLYEVNNGVVTTIRTAQNSFLDSTFFGTTKIGGLKYDNDGNLWITNVFSNTPVHVITPSGDVESFAIPQMTSGEAFTKVVIDNNNYKWMISPKSKKVAVFDDNGTLDNTSDDRIAINANIPGSKLYSIAEDKDGEVWVGTDEGVAVFYSSSSVFDDPIEAEQIFIQQDGITQILLETEGVYAIAIDGANRKWFGTQNSGVYLMSEDGTEEIEHFTTENSPLFSNTVYDIVINDETGEVFFGTEKGLISYKGTATEPDDDFNNVFVYPNPIRPDYEGVIAIRGLVEDTDVRITDISGNIVFETTSLGGQAIWNGKDFHGNRVQSGVYMVFNGSKMDQKKLLPKFYSSTNAYYY